MEVLICSKCEAEIPAEGVGNANTLLQFLRVIQHLKGAPHYFKRPVHLLTETDGLKELFCEENKPRSVIVFERK